MIVVIIIVVLLLYGLASQFNDSINSAIYNHKKRNEYESEFEIACRNWDHVVRTEGLELSNEMIFHQCFDNNKSSTFDVYIWRESDRLCIFASRPKHNDGRSYKNWQYEENIDVQVIDINEYCAVRRLDNNCYLFYRNARGEDKSLAFRIDEYERLKYLISK